MIIKPENTLTYFVNRTDKINHDMRFQVSQRCLIFQF